jgi:hypothetical protein
MSGFTVAGESTKLQVCTVVLRLPVTVRGFAMVAIFTTNVDAENQTLINHKTVCGALNRHFCQTAVSCSAIFYELVLVNVN